MKLVNTIVAIRMSGKCLYLIFHFVITCVTITPQENNSTQHNKVQSHHEMKVLY